VLTGSAALLAKMRADRAQPPARPAAAAAAAASGSTAKLWILYGGEAAAQVAADLAKEAADSGMPNTLLSMDKFQVRRALTPTPVSTRLGVVAESLRELCACC